MSIGESSINQLNIETHLFKATVKIVPSVIPGITGEMFLHYKLMNADISDVKLMNKSTCSSAYESVRTIVPSDCISANAYKI